LNDLWIRGHERRPNSIKYQRALPPLCEATIHSSGICASRFRSRSLIYIKPFSPLAINASTTASEAKIGIPSRSVYIIVEIIQRVRMAIERRAGWTICHFRREWPGRSEALRYENIHSAAVSKLTTIIARTEAGADNGGRRR